jgi:uncharacterized protein (DUF2252 family)
MMSTSEQLAAGRAARQRCPRSGHADAGRSDRDPVALITASDADRVPELVPLRHSRMLESPFAFFRGAAAVQAYDLARTPQSGFQVQACGDCHLLNFGGFATPERNLVFDINDFDETLPAPWEWDVKRLTASLVLAARWHHFSSSAAGEIVTAAVAAYRERIVSAAQAPTLETWYAQITFAEIEQKVRGQAKLAKRLAAEVAEAQRNTSEHVFHKLVTDDNGVLRILDQPPLLYHPRFDDVLTRARSFLRHYETSLREEYRALFSRFKFVDAAFKVVGVGSVGTRCYVVLLLGAHGDPLFLQIKEAQSSVLERYAGASPWQNHGERVVTGQRMMQAVSDIFLGWARGADGRDFYVRQLRDMKLAPDPVSFDTPSLLRTYGELCGWALGRAHAKGGAAPRIAGYLGTGGAFASAIERYALDYADQVERDFTAFQAAARSGRIAIETSPSAIEAMIR